MLKVFNRLYVKVYLTIVSTLLLVVIVSALVWRSGPEMDAAHSAFEMMTGVAAAALADPNAPAVEQQKAVERLAALLKTDLALYDANDRLLGSAGNRPLPSPNELTDRKRWFGHSDGPVWSFQLPDRRMILVRPAIEHRGHGMGFIGYLALIALLLALGSLPVVRGLTRRLERLQQGVESLGAGDLTARVKVEGRDEVASVAESFNRAARRIEELVRAHKMLLANASHELRTPLTRLRMGVELLKDKADPQRKAELEQDIAELDQLIDEILLTSRLDAMQNLETVEDIDLLALAAEEASRFDGVSVSGQALATRGDARLLRRLLRNLIENAKRHGAPPVEIEVQARQADIVLTVFDHGPGVPEADRGLIFEPFFRSSTAGEKSLGTGLGLALVRQIARRHRGDVECVHADNGRNGFAVTLPGA
ncbi:MAG: HAMP domain-containing protein [Alphaproteobacteria bacterium]|nr:HAMP domain-containing protein [Alphaproteobacteria bacterium]